MPPKKAYIIAKHNRTNAATNVRGITARTQGPTANELSKLNLAKAISKSIPEDQIALYEYAIFPEYYKKINNNVLDYADVILVESPYNGNTKALNVDNLSADEYNAYVTHLKSVTKLRRNQYDYNNEWIPNGNATFAKSYKAAAIVDIVIVENNTIKEMWFVTASNENIPDRVKNILDIGYTDIPIYLIHPSTVKTYSDVSYNFLYTKARELATQVNSKYAGNTDNVEYNHTIDTVLLLAKFIKDNVDGFTPCIKYPILEKYGNILIDLMVDDFANKLLKHKPYKNSTMPLDINKLSDDDIIDYLKHLKTISSTEQDGLNNYWIPNKHIQMLNLYMLKGVIDIAITDGEVITELWDISAVPEINEKRITSIKSAGFDHVPIYQITRNWLIANKDDDNLYELAKQNALKLN